MGNMAKSAAASERQQRKPDRCTELLIEELAKGTQPGNSAEYQGIGTGLAFHERGRHFRHGAIPGLKRRVGV